MERGLADFESLILECRSERSRSLIREAVACYNGGAYRSSISMTWIAAVYDIIEKCREMSFAGHTKATEIYQAFEHRQTLLERGRDIGAIRRSLDFEREIADIAFNQLRIIDHVQHATLNRLKEDRNLCSHPSYQQIDVPFEPTPERARFHIRETVAGLLAQPPIQGRFAADRIMNMVSSSFLPAAMDKLEGFIISSGYINPSDGLTKDIVGRLFYKLFDIKKKQSNTRFEIALIHVLYKMDNAAVAKSEITRLFTKEGHSISDDDLGALVSLCLDIRDAPANLDTITHEKFSNYIRQSLAKDNQHLLITASKHPEFKKPSIQAIRFANDEQIQQYIMWLSLFEDDNSVSLMDEIVDLLAHRYGRSKSFDEANSRYHEWVKSLTRSLTDDCLTRFLRVASAQKGDLKGSYGFDDLKEYAYEREGIESNVLDEILP